MYFLSWELTFQQGCETSASFILGRVSVKTSGAAQKETMGLLLLVEI